MKKILFLIVSIILCFCFSACGTSNNNATNNGDENRIIYSTNFGAKIESFSEEKQSEISNYVADCKVLFVNAYREKTNERHDGQITNPYIDFTDVFVYDFSNVIETTLDNNSLKVWKKIKELRNNEVKPLMYIQINGYCQYFSNDYIATQLGETAIVNGFFIYNDNMVMPMPYQHVASSLYIFELPKGTVTINCGNKYSQKHTLSDINNFDGKLKTLEVVA